MKGNQSFMLIIEDNNDLTSLSNLFMLDGFDRPVKSYRNTNEALKYLEESNNDYGWNVNLPDLIIIDFIKSKKESYEFITTLKIQNNLKMIPIIVLGENFNKEELRQLYESGANSCIEKPKDMAEMKNLCSILHKYWIQTILF